ncbi:TerB family tellurite resistance protein [Parasulfitobacter algicola]|uniref:TerB family tellurite resistance protein n=1 Tax=Parasulfitobacter algicola TaxID=2614809 RepID=A0ABX2IR16_9RHOB|nr:TerB family tellurite resistance protein [Sulfitobacter algicola]NSX55324.1 TerB family tellurite resistance protein [Sulfitobacter algicola]
MIFIWGSRGRAKSIENGDFFCPECNGRQDMDLMHVKNWFTFYWIPIFPMGDLGKYVECKRCKATFNERIRDYDPESQAEAFEAEFSIAAKRVMFKMALADGEIDDAEVAQITQAFQNIAKREIDPADMAAELEMARNDTLTVKDYLTDVAPGLNDTGKELVLRSAIAVAKADGNVDPEEIVQIKEVIAALDMPKAYANGVLAEEGLATI